MRRRLAFSIISTIGVVSCDRHSERVILIEASHLRHEIIRPINVHVVLVDVDMSRHDWELVQEKDTVLEIEPCKSPGRRTLFSMVGVAEVAKPTFYNGQPIYRITFKIFSTNVPSEIPKTMASVECLRLSAGAGYGWTSYFSDPISIKRSSD